jgi:dihydroneopterin aldolase
MRDVPDNIDQTVNYSVVAEKTKSFVRDQSVNLIETLADLNAQVITSR